MSSAARPSWEIDASSEPGLLKVILRGRMSENEMRAFVAAHSAAIDAINGKDYKVFVDIRELHPLSPACAALFEKAKACSDRHSNFRGSAVWVSGAIVALQHSRTSRTSGVFDVELRSTDEADLRRHLTSVWRTRPQSDDK